MDTGHLDMLSRDASQYGLLELRLSGLNGGHRIEPGDAVGGLKPGEPFIFCLVVFWACSRAVMWYDKIDDGERVWTRPNIYSLASFPTTFSTISSASHPAGTKPSAVLLSLL